MASRDAGDVTRPSLRSFFPVEPSRLDAFTAHELELLAAGLSTAVYDLYPDDPDRRRLVAEIGGELEERSSRASATS